MLIRKHFVSIKAALAYSINLADCFNEIEPWVELDYQGHFNVIYVKGE